MKFSNTIDSELLLNVVMVLGTEPAWIDVLTDLLLSLLSQPQNLPRVIVNLSFIQLIPHFTTTSLRLIIDVSRHSVIIIQ